MDLEKGFMKYVSWSVLGVGITTYLMLMAFCMVIYMILIFPLQYIPFYKKMMNEYYGSGRYE